MQSLWILDRNTGTQGHKSIKCSRPAHLLLVTCALITYALIACGAVAQAENPVPGAVQGNETATTTVTSEPIGEEDQATTEVPADANSTQGKGRGTRGFGNFQIILLIAMVFFVFMMFRGPRKKQQEHKKMVQSLQKNDRVRTIGGIYGTVVDVRDDEIVLKVDESSNTKIKVSPSAIGTRLSEKDS